MERILLLPVLLLSVVVHEFAHAWQARREGDNTAQLQGRLTLNPIPHIDLFGSILFPLLLFILRAPFMLGWAKPVPVNPQNYRNYKMGDIRVSLAGIVSNLILAAGCVIAIGVVSNLRRLVPGIDPVLGVAEVMFRFGLLINLVLAFFNLIPIPPLDGSHVLYHLLPPRLGVRYRQLGQYGMFVLLGLMFLFPQRFFVLISAPVGYVMRLAEAFLRLWT